MLSPYYNVEFAEDGEQAWEKICNKQFDLILSDVNLPRIDGLELIKKVKTLENYSNIPIIIASGDGDGVAQAKEMGINLWLIKPVKPQSLLKAVKALLAQTLK